MDEQAPYHDQNFTHDFRPANFSKKRLPDVEEDFSELSNSFEESKGSHIPETLGYNTFSNEIPRPKSYDCPWKKEIEDIIRNC